VAAQRVALLGIGLGVETSTPEEPENAASDAPRHPLDLAVARGRQRPEAETVRCIVDAVQDERVEVHVEVERAPEPLHERDRPAVESSRILALKAAAGAAPQRREDAADEEAQDLGGQPRVVGHPVAQAEGKRKDPLPHRRFGQHAVHEVGGRVRHTPSPAGAAEAASLAGEGHQAVAAAGVTVDAQEAVGEDATLKEAPELPLHEARRRPAGPGQERLQSLGDDCLEERLLRPARCVNGRGSAPWVGRRCATWSRIPAGARTPVASLEPRAWSRSILGELRWEGRLDRIRARWSARSKTSWPGIPPSWRRAKAARPAASSCASQIMCFPPGRSCASLGNEDMQTPIFDWMDRFLPQHYDVVGVADIVSPYRTVYLWDDAARKYEGESRSQLWVYRRKSP
jgi:hypothetical protein